MTILYTLHQDWKGKKSDDSTVAKCIICNKQYHNKIKNMSRLCGEERAELFMKTAVCTSPPLSAEGVELPTKFSKRGGLTKSQLWEGVDGKEEGGHGGLQYYKQTKAKIWNI